MSIYDAMKTPHTPRPLAEYRAILMALSALVAVFAVLWVASLDVARFLR